MEAEAEDVRCGFSEKLVYDFLDKGLVLRVDASLNMNVDNEGRLQLKLVVSAMSLQWSSLNVGCV